MFDAIAAHVDALGGLESERGGPLQPLSEENIDALSELIGAPLPPALRWWFATYGAGIKFREPIVYISREGHEVMIGYFITPDEIRETFDNFESSLVPHRLPFNDDMSGNYIVVDTSGAVYWHIHDAYTDRNAVHIADTFEQFVLMLRVGS